MMTTVSQLQTEAAKLIAQRSALILGMELKPIIEHHDLHVKLNGLNTRIDQYEKSIKALKGIKRRMMR